MYLIDTNIILELLLNQEKADEAQAFLRDSPPESLCLSEFTLYSLGLILLKRKMHDVFLQTLNDLLADGGIQVVRLSAEDMQSLVQSARRFNLDFDDAYQYTVAEKYDLTVVSFDADFDRTERGRKTPAESLPEPSDPSASEAPPQGS